MVRHKLEPRARTSNTRKMAPARALDRELCAKTMSHDQNSALVFAT